MSLAEVARVREQAKEWRAAHLRGVALAPLRKSARTGDELARFRLGSRYDRSDARPQDYVAAHKWFSIANVTGLKRAIVNRDIVTGLMTPGRIAAARDLTAAWMARWESRN